MYHFVSCNVRYALNKCSALLIAAGYLEDPEEQIRREKVEKAFQHVLTDPQYKHGTRLRNGHLSLDIKRFIVEMYEKTTGRSLLQ